MIKKGSFQSVMAILVALTAVLIVIISFSTNTSNVVDRTHEGLDMNKLADFVGVGLYTEEIRYNAVGELDEDMVAYARKITEQIFDPDYADKIYDDRDKHLKKFDYFDLTDREYAIKFYDEPEGVGVQIIDNKNNYYELMSYKDTDFLKNKHVAVVTGNPKGLIVTDGCKLCDGLPDLETNMPTTRELGVTWLMNKYCSVNIGKVETGTDSYTKNLEGISSSFSCQNFFPDRFGNDDESSTCNTIKHKIDHLSSQNPIIARNVYEDMRNYILDVQSIEIAPRNALSVIRNGLSDALYSETAEEKEKPFPEIAWYLENSAMDDISSMKFGYQRMKSVLIDEEGKYADHIVLKLTPEDTDKVFPYNFKLKNENPDTEEVAELFVFFPSILNAGDADINVEEGRLQVKVQAGYPVENVFSYYYNSHTYQRDIIPKTIQYNLNGGTLILWDGEFKLGGLGFLQDISVKTLIDHIDACK